MTTVAYRAGILAGDGRITEGETVMTDKARKVFRLRDGRLFGYAGAEEDGHRLLAAVRKGLAMPKLEEITALLIGRDGAIDLYEGNVWVRQRLAYYAIGSGAPYALGVMDAGGDAIRAATIGTRRDIYSGGRVRIVRLKRTS